MIDCKFNLNFWTNLQSTTLSFWPNDVRTKQVLLKLLVSEAKPAFGFSLTVKPRNYWTWPFSTNTGKIMTRSM